MNWCDSSDEEDEAFLSPVNNPPIVAPVVQESSPEQPPDDEYNNDQQNLHSKGSFSKTTRRPKKEVILPTQPPYTAHIGNLAFSIRDPQELADAVYNLVKDLLGQEIVITAQRIALDRQMDNKPKGFGYVEVETLDHLKAVLRLEEYQPMVAGRCIHLSVGQPLTKPPSRQSSSTRTSSFGGGNNNNANFNTQNNTNKNNNTNTIIDGSKFQGGRYNRESSGSFRRNNNNDPAEERSFRRKDSSGSFRRSESVGSSGAAGTGASQQQQTTPAPPLGERPSLKLRPRSQTVGSMPMSSTGASSTIFGGAKPRDHESWERERSTNSAATTTAVAASAAGGSTESDAPKGGSGDNRKPRNTNSATGRDYPSAGRTDGRDGSGRGRGGGRGAGRDGGGGRTRNDRKPARQSSTGRSGTSSNKAEGKKKEDVPSKTGPLLTVDADKVANPKTVVTNKFAALNFDDSDEE